VPINRVSRTLFLVAFRLRSVADELLLALGISGVVEAGSTLEAVNVRAVENIFCGSKREEVVVERIEK